MTEQNRTDFHISKSTGAFRRCIIDVGCHTTGIRGKQLKQKHNVPCIYIDADYFSVNSLRVDPEDLIIWAAISSRSGIGKFNIYSFPGTHSLCDINMDNASSWKLSNHDSAKGGWAREEVNFVPMITLKDIIETMEIDEIVSLKIDAQGHDLEVIRGLGERIKIVKHVELEVQITEKELYNNSSKKPDVIAYMTQHGFSLTGSDTQSCGQESNLYFTNIEI